MLLVCSMIMLSMMAVAQEHEYDDVVFDVVDQMPTFNHVPIEIND